MCADAAGVRKNVSISVCVCACGVCFNKGNSLCTLIYLFKTVSLSSLHTHTQSATLATAGPRLMVTNRPHL